MTNSKPVDYSKDALQPLQAADLIRYRDICATKLPATLQPHHFLTVQHRWWEIFVRPENETQTRNISPKCVNKFYAPSTRNTDNCTFVAISDELHAENGPGYCIFAFTLEWPPTELISCLRDSMRIHWHNEPLIEALSNELVPIVKTLLLEKDKRACDKWTESSNCVWLAKAEAIAFDIKYECVPAVSEPWSSIRNMFSIWISEFPMNIFSMSWTNNMRPQSTTHGHTGIIVHSIIFDRCFTWTVDSAYSKSQPNEFLPGYWPTITWQSGKSVWSVWTLNNLILCAKYLLHADFSADVWKQFHRQEEKDWPEYLFVNNANDLRRPSSSISLRTLENRMLFRCNYSKASDFKDLTDALGYKWRIHRHHELIRFQDISIFYILNNKLR